MIIFLIISEIRQGCPFLTFLFNSALEFPAREVVGKNEIKGIQIGKKKEPKLCLFTNDIILNTEYPKEHTHTHT